MKNGILLILASFGVLFFSSMMLKVNQDAGWPVPDKYQKMKNPFTDADDEDEIGKRLYATHCKSCHGAKGLGDGTKAAELKTKVQDMTSSTFKSQSDGAIYYKIYVGREDMPSFEKKITEEEDQWLLVNFVKNL